MRKNYYGKSTTRNYVPFHLCQKTKFEILLLVRSISYILRNIYNFHSGTYQIRMAKSYIQEHLTTSVPNEDELEFIVESCPTQTDLV